MDDKQLKLLMKNLTGSGHHPQFGNNGSTSLSQSKVKAMTLSNSTNVMANENGATTPGLAD